MRKRTGGGILPPGRWARFRRLLAYYLECVQEDHQQEIRFARDSTPTDYVFFNIPREWNLLEEAQAEKPLPHSAAGLVIRTRLRGQSAQLFYGYPLLASWEPDGERSGASSCFLLPLFTQPVEIATGGLYAPSELKVRLTPDWPRVNREALRRIFGSTEEQDDVLGQIGLLDWSVDLPAVRIADAVKKLMHLNLPIPGIEPLDPEKLVSEKYTGQGETGLLNRAILFLAQPSRYTAGLERELKELVKVGDDTLDRTALAPLFSEGWSSPPPAIETHGIVEVRGLNGGQRRACDSSLNSALTVVTGPPGTGKSQVVVNVLANCFLRSTPAVFSSRNHKAVSVVEERINTVASAPILFRLGSQGGLAAQLGNVLTPLLSSSGNPESAAQLKAVQQAYAAAVGGRKKVGERIASVLNTRNIADQLDRELEPWRRKLTADEWAVLEGVRKVPEPRVPEEAVRLLSLHAPSSASRRMGLFAAVRRPFDINKAARFLKKVIVAFPVLGQLAPRKAEGTFLNSWLAQASRACDLAKASVSLREYLGALEALTKSEPLDELTLEMNQHRLEVARLGREILELHTSHLGHGLSRHSRASAGELLAVVRNLTGLDPRSKEAWRLRKQVQELLPRVTTFLPSWAITNLSAPGAIPFHAGMFDLAVIDEASQCDTPSAIPLLFRCRRAVVIGDPQQLRHISALPQARASQLAAKHKLTEAADQPFTFVNNSLYDLAAASAGARVFALQDHYRSHADIVGFSNAHWYRNDLRIQTDYCGLKTPDGEPPGIIWTQVESKIFRPNGGGAIAPEEANRVIKEVIALLAKTGFEGTVGVVSPFRAQANRIREGLVRRLPPAAIERVELVADTAHGFQGDERDVVVFSPCVGASLPPGGRMFLAKTANLFNVAVTRARAQLRVIGDLGACKASGIPHIEAFARHYLSLQAAASSPVDGRIGYFERPLEEALRKAGVVAIPQYVFGRYRLDLAVVEGGLKIDIEVDGEHFHKDLSGERCWEDLNRDQYLTQRGWKVLRFWAVEVRDRLDSCVERILRAKSQVHKDGVTFSPSLVG